MCERGRAPLKSKEATMAKVTKDMIISDILQVDAGIAPILLSKGMNCIGCPAAKGETLEEAAVVHGMDADALAEEINNYLEAQG